MLSHLIRIYWWWNARQKYLVGNMLGSDSPATNQKVQMQEHFLFLILMKTKKQNKKEKANKKSNRSKSGNVHKKLVFFSSSNTVGFISDTQSFHIQFSSKYNLTFISLILKVFNWKLFVFVDESMKKKTTIDKFMIVMMMIMMRKMMMKTMMSIL